MMMCLYIQIKKSIFAFFAFLLMFTISCSVSTPLTPWDGKSTTEPPKESGVYIITEAAHLAWLAAQTIDIKTDIRFDKNIDMNNEAFKGIHAFYGNIEGNGRKIYGLNIDSTIGHAGLIQQMFLGSIKNLTIESGTITGTLNVGAFVGTIHGQIDITNVINKADVTSTDSAGGIIGILIGGVTIKNVGNSGNIIAGVAGGIIGATGAGITTIKNSSNSGAITASDTGGGIIGSGGGGDVTIDNAYNYISDIKMVGNDAGNKVTIGNSYTLNSGDDKIAPSKLEHLTAGKFKIQKSFTGWDFRTIWVMGALYPLLR